MLIRKLEEKEKDLFCCDYNDVCEHAVSHLVSNDDTTNKKYYCQEHMDEVRKTINK